MEFSYRGLSLSPPHQPVFLSFRITAGAGKPNANKHKCCVVQWCRGKYHSFSLSQFFPLLLLFTLICLTVFFMTLHKWQACLLEEFYCEIKQRRCRNHSHARLLKILLFFKKISCCSSCLTFLRIIRFVWLKNHFGCWRSKTFSHPVPLPFFYSSAGKCCQRGENIFREAPLWEHPRNKQDTAHSAHTRTKTHPHTHFAQAYTEEPRQTLFQQCWPVAVIQTPHPYENPDPVSSHETLAEIWTSHPRARLPDEIHIADLIVAMQPSPIPQRKGQPDGRTDNSLPCHSLIAKTLIEHSPTTSF